MNTRDQRTTPAEHAGERLLKRLGVAGRGAELESTPSLLGGMTSAEEDELASVLTRRVLESKAPETEAPAALPLRRIRPKGRTWGLGSGIAIAASLAFGWLAREEPTSYRLEATGSDSEYRGAEQRSDALPVHHTGSRLAFVLRPSQQPRRLGVPRVALVGKDVVRELNPTWESAESGAFRLEARVGELLSDRIGETTLAFTVAPSREAAVVWPGPEDDPEPDMMIYRFEILKE